MSMAWKTSLPASQKMALLAMCDWANDEGGSLHPSIARVAERVSCSERQAQRVIHGLVDTGWLVVVGNANGGAPGQARRYQINVDRLENVAFEAAKKSQKSTKNQPVFNGETGDTGVTGDTSGRVTSATQTGDIHDMRRVTSATKRGDTHVTLTTIEPPIEPSGNHQYAQARPSDVAEQVWFDFLALRKEKRARLTSTALAGIRSAAAKAGLSLQAALEVCCERGWQSFRAEWLAPGPGVGQEGKPGLSKTEALRERNRQNARQWLNETAGESHASV
jgi:hypothetical protein